MNVLHYILKKLSFWTFEVQNKKTRVFSVTQFEAKIHRKKNKMQEKKFIWLQLIKFLISITNYTLNYITYFNSN